MQDLMMNDSTIHIPAVGILLGWIAFYVVLRLVIYKRGLGTQRMKKRVIHVADPSWIPEGSLPEYGAMLIGVVSFIAAAGVFGFSYFMGMETEWDIPMPVVTILGGAEILFCALMFHSFYKAYRLRDARLRVKYKFEVRRKI